jgi:hypothetical protein
MHKGHYSDSYYVLAKFLGRFARSIAAISTVFRVYVKFIIDPWIDHLQDHSMGRITLIRWYIYLGLYTHEVGWPSDAY